MTGQRAATGLSAALGAGLLGGIQPKINASLGAQIDSALLASLVNFCVAFGVVVGVVAWPVAFFAGQIVASVIVDRVGIAPGGAKPLVGGRVLAAAIALAAVAASQVGRPVGDVAPALVVLTVLAGSTVAFQSAFNGRITLAVRDAAAATAVNVTVGLTLVVVLVAAGALTGDVSTVRWPAEPWLYAGGLLGVTIVFSLAVATAALRVLQATIAMLAAQLVTAFAVDWITKGDTPTVGVLVGALLIVGAVLLVRRSSSA